MRIGYALDTHATPGLADDVSWPRLRELVVLAEAVGFDLVVVPDHLLYRPGGENDYAREDEPVGAWESVVLATAIAGATNRLTVSPSSGVGSGSKRRSSPIAAPPRGRHSRYTRLPPGRRSGREPRFEQGAVRRPYVDMVKGCNAAADDHRRNPIKD